MKHLKKIIYVLSAAKNKYGWGPPSSTFTFFNKGIGNGLISNLNLIIHEVLLQIIQLNKSNTKIRENLKLKRLLFKIIHLRRNHFFKIGIILNNICI